jgi:hypothetical protein
VTWIWQKPRTGSGGSRFHGYSPSTFAHTARDDLSEGQVSPKELAEGLGGFYEKTDVTMLRDPGQNEFSYTGLIACGLTFEALPMCWFTEQEHYFEVSIPFNNSSIVLRNSKPSFVEL